MEEFAHECSRHLRRRFAFFMLGGLWFTPLFGKQWDKAVGFNLPAK
jgi:hypothetical protein